MVSESSPLPLDKVIADASYHSGGTGLLIHHVCIGLGAVIGHDYLSHSLNPQYPLSNRYNAIQSAM